MHRVNGHRLHTVLIVDDEKTIRDYLKAYFNSSRYRTMTAASGLEAVEQLRQATVDVVLLDMMMPEMDGLETLRQIREIDSDLPVVILSAIGQAQSVVQAMTMGASDYLTKPFEDEELELAIAKVLEKWRLIQEVRNLRELVGEDGISEIASASPKMQAVKKLLIQVAATDATVMIQGESGVGKELVARAIHRNSRRSQRPYVRINCAALPADLLESELFGYERGAFTGAIREKPGKFELAHEGTIFLDEVTEMGPALQAKFLHVLQDGEFSKLGGRKDIKVDVRVVAATNRVLEQAVAEGHFREDFYYRLNVVTITVPPLRERIEDIPVLARYFQKRFAHQYNNPSAPELSDKILHLFMEYRWPGNVRELENLMRRWIILNDEKSLRNELVMKMNSELGAGAPMSQNGLSLKQVSRKRSMEVERELILSTLHETGWHLKRTAERLKISYRALQYKVKDYGLSALK